MGCAPCAAAAALAASTPSTHAVLTPEQQLSNEDCPHTLNTLTNWKTKLIEIKSAETQDLFGITIFKVNEMLGVVQSALNFPVNFCFFAPLLNTYTSIFEIIDNEP